MVTCDNHPERKAHRKTLCKSCYERALREANPEYAARCRESKRRIAKAAKEKNTALFAEKARQSTARYRENHPERVKTPWQVDPVKARASVDKYREANVEVVRQRSRDWYAENLEKSLKYRELNKDVRAARSKAWRIANPDKSGALRAAYRAAKLKATPAWANKNKIVSIYKAAINAGLEVDHVIPLRGKNVCGLHVENNLQLLTRTENACKGNSYAG